MAIDLTQTAIDPETGGVPPTRNTRQALENALKDLQGNILKSHGRDHSVHLFVTFKADNPTDRQKARKWLASTATLVTSAMEQWEEARNYRRALQHIRGNTKLSTDERRKLIWDASGVFVGVMLSAHAYRDLGLGALMPDDPSFAAGAKARVNDLHDPPTKYWDDTFQRDLHALVTLADDHATDRLEPIAKGLTDELKAIGAEFARETGTAMRLDADGNESPTAPVREHFGFVDGISQPLFFASDIEQARIRHGGIDQYDPSAPLGQVLVKDPAGDADGYGSYFVYRKLKQDVHGFRADERQLAEKIATYAHPESPDPTEADIALAGAYMVGRFQDGTPVVDRALPGLGDLTNNFTFDADVDGVRCPFQAHARKSNPRGDKQRQYGVPITQERSRRIARRAISYGPVTLTPDKHQEVGLLFLCAQSSIADQFEFIQAQWANNEDFLRNDCGLDPVIGTLPKESTSTGGAAKNDEAQTHPVDQRWPKLYGSRNELDFSKQPPGHTDWFFTQRVGEWVTMRGGEYFFVPSLSALKKFGTVDESQGNRS